MAMVKKRRSEYDEEAEVAEKDYESFETSFV